MKIVFLDTESVGNASLEPIAALGDLVTYGRTLPGQVAERISDAQVIITNKVVITANLMRKAPGLRLICVAATGVNNIDLAAAKELGIAVRNVAAYSTPSVLQATFSHILNLRSKISQFDAYVKDGRYSKSGLFTCNLFPFDELDGQTIGIIGMGAIGSGVAKVAQAFGMNVIYYSTSGTHHCTCYPSVTLDELLAKSDIVSIHCPLNEHTRGLIGAQQLSRMKPSAILVNVARGLIVDETALAQAIDNGIIAGAALDVFSQEPLDPDSPLLHTLHPERLSLSPHIAWASSQARKRLVQGIADNIKSEI